MAHKAANVRGTEISQVNLRNLSDARKVFSYSGKSIKKPIVGVGPSACCCQCFVQIPSGFHLIFSKWDDVWKTPDGHPYKREGLVLCWPWYKRVSHVVTQKAVRYNAPVANCPTSDNVLVSVDVSFNFQIVDAHKFIFTMGAGRFQELLRVETEEAIRTLVYTKEVATIHDTTVDSSHSKLVENALNRSVVGYGVRITGIRITDVKLPDKLQSEMTEQTKLKATLNTMQKQHNLKLDKLRNVRLQQNKTFQRNFERQAAEQKVEVIKEGTMRETQLQKIRAEEEQEIIAAQTEAAAKITESKSKERDATTQAQQKAVEIMNKAFIASEKSLNNCERDVQRGIIEAKANARSRVTEAEARQEKARTTAAKRAIKLVSDAKIGAEKTMREAEQKVDSSMARARGIQSTGKAKAEGIIAMSEAEKLGATSMKAARLQEVELERLGILEQLAGSGNMMLTGQRAAQVMDFLAPTGLDKASAFTTKMMSDEL